MTQIQVKDSQWYKDVYGMVDRVKVYVGETKAEHDARYKHEYDKYIEARYMGYSGFDEHPDETGDLL